MEIAEVKKVRESVIEAYKLVAATRVNSMDKEIAVAVADTLVVMTGLLNILNNRMRMENDTLHSRESG